MKNSIFKNAKFGDKFLTRDGRVALYVRFISHPCEDRRSYHHSLITSESNVVRTYNDYGYAYATSKQDFDIVSRYREPIEEDKLDELADEYVEEMFSITYPKNDFYALETKNNFKAGYRKAMEE